MMGTPRRSNAELQLPDVESEDEDETESASVTRHVPARVSRDGHEVPLETSELVNMVNLPAVAIEIKKDFLTSVYAGLELLNAIKRHVQRLIESVFARANQSVINTLLCN